MEWRYRRSHHMDDDPSLQYITLNLSSLQPGLLVSAVAVSLTRYCPLLVCLYRMPDEAALTELMDEAEQCLFRGLYYDMTYGQAAVPSQLQQLFGQAAASYKVGPQRRSR